MSRPARGGWIEIPIGAHCTAKTKESRPARGGWIEMYHIVTLPLVLPSRPARGGWIEIQRLARSWAYPKVPSREGRVD